MKSITTKVADWQIATFDQHIDYRALPTNPKVFREKRPYDDLTWHMGALYAGMNEFRGIAENPATYTEWLAMTGDDGSMSPPTGILAGFLLIFFTLTPFPGSNHFGTSCRPRSSFDGFGKIT